ncbi:MULTISPECIES: hypothetical protein [Brevibacillus]|uniref:hypothetical protein n=1 Tax=Brevibacillus TaxID=55080 RepID=UPI000D0F625F|nr:MULTISPECIES: hypothetical protein [Brevibacillus]PSJ71274.1 hypothetical protein C7J99_00205 [Brevibacillus brevis]RED28877.1 hypothetical protein DES34_107228 [Brevibacillus brevis]TQK62001.1 hypothetical protein FB479_10684 [Brevibacillus sp. AG162]VEF91528.1 Uncharacterised protein [Brevibacillus brevis]GEC90312.1 hypothetical protein BBR01nite_26430 [Brevibacillus brevis]
MKKLYSLFLAICLMVVFSVPFASAAEVNEKATPIHNERVISILKKNNIDFKIADGNLKLVETSPESIAKVNKLLVSEFKPSLKAAVSYPTPYVHMKLHDIKTSQKFIAATKTALAAAVIEWAKNKGVPDPRKIGVAAAGGFAAYYFINTDKEDLYFYIKYSYRELSAGKFDMNGNFIGDYEIKKEIRVTKNSNYTGGNLEVDVRKSSILDPWF